MPNYNGSAENVVLATLTELVKKQDNRLDRLEAAIHSLKDAIVSTAQQTQTILMGEIRSLESEVDDQSTLLSKHETKIAYLEEVCRNNQQVIAAQAVEIGKQQQFMRVVGAISIAAIGAVLTIVINNSFKPATAGQKRVSIEAVSFV